MGGSGGGDLEQMHLCGQRVLPLTSVLGRPEVPCSPLSRGRAPAWAPPLHRRSGGHTPWPVSWSRMRTPSWAPQGQREGPPWVVMPVLLAQGTRPCSSFWVLAGPEDSAPTLGVTGTAPPKLGLSNRCHMVGRVQQPLSWDGNGTFGFKPRDEEVTQTVVQTFLSPLSP